MIKPNPQLFLGCPAELRRYIADLEQQVKTADERTVAAIQHQQALHQQLKQSSLDPHCAFASSTMCGNALTPQQNGGFPTEQCNYVKHQSSQPDLHHMFIEQNLERRTEPRQPLEFRTKPMVEGGFYNSFGAEATPEQIAEQKSKPVTSFDWELLQAMNHLTTAIGCTDDVRAVQLTAALNIVKGASADD